MPCLYSILLHPYFYKDQSIEKILQKLENKISAGNRELRWEKKNKESKPRRWPIQELDMKFMMVIDLKCFTLKIFFIKCVFESA